MDDFRKLRFRAPPGIPGQTYNDIGVSAVAMGGGDILPALEKGVIDAAEWCCPVTVDVHVGVHHDLVQALQVVVLEHLLEAEHGVGLGAAPLGGVDDARTARRWKSWSTRTA